MDVEGIGIGIGAGIGIGIGAGRKAAVDTIRKYAQANHVTIQRNGSLVSVEGFLAEALKTELAGKKKALVVTILVLGVLVLLGIVLYTARG